jgi:arylsulfatase A-like enzyme
MHHMRSSAHAFISTLATAAAVAVVIGGLACDKKPEPAPGPQPPAADGKPVPAPVPAADRGDEIRLYDFVDNRLLAHQLVGGGLVVSPGSGGFAKYEHFARPKVSWKQDRKDGKKVGIADKYASLDVPLTASQASGNLTMRLFADSPRGLEIKSGGKIGKVELQAGWQTVSLPMTAAAGETRFQIVSTKDGPTVEWLQFGGTPPADDVVAPLYDASAKALALPEGGGAAYYTYVPQKGRVVAAVRGAGCKLEVAATAEGKKPVTGAISGNGAVDLAPLAGQIVRIELIARGCAKALVSDAGIAVPGKVPAVKKAARPKYVVFWIMDSLRADRVRPFNPRARPETPVWASLVKKGAVFMRNYVQGNESQASHASMWTSTYVGTHRYIPSGNKGIPASFVTIDEVMKGAGFMTSGVSANGFITKKNGFAGKFDLYRNHIHDGGGVRGEDVLKAALASVEGKQARPWFLYIGTIDTHVSWRAKEPWISKYDPGYKGRFEKEILGKDVDNGIKLTEREKEHVRAIYDSNVSYQDKLLGDLLAKLEAWGIADQTMIVVTADHGDEQWENGRVGHGASLVEWLEHVPMAIIYPPLIPAGEIQEGSESIDILPTIIDAIGGTLPAGMQGRSLVPLTQGIGKGYLAPSIASKYELEWVMRLGDWKLRTAGGNTELYDLASDYYEKKDLADSRAIERRYLTDALSTFLVNQKDWRKSTDGLANNMTAAGAAKFDK